MNSDPKAPGASAAMTYRRSVYVREVRWYGWLVGAVRAWLLVAAEEATWRDHPLGSYKGERKQ